MAGATVKNTLDRLGLDIRAHKRLFPAFRLATAKPFPISRQHRQGKFCRSTAQSQSDPPQGPEHGAD